MASKALYKLQNLILLLGTGRLTIPVVSQTSTKLVSADTSRCLPAESPWLALLCQAAAVVCYADGATKTGSSALQRR